MERWSVFLLLMPFRYVDRFAIALTFNVFKRFDAIFKPALADLSLLCLINNLVLTNTLGPHKPSRRWTWHSPDGKHHNQIDYILVKKRFRSGVNIHRTRSFPGADIGSDHDLVMMTFQVRLKKTRKPNQPRPRFDLEKLRDPDVACTFQASIGGKFAPLIGLSDEDMG